jgi:RNA-directed DNA polymerase
MENWQYHNTYSGTPQGGIISPLLCNVFLHQLDTYMEQLGANRGQTNTEKAARRSPAYESLHGRITRTGKQFREAPNRRERTALLTKLLALKRQRQSLPVYSTRHQTKLGYSRYADDFVILVNGTQEEARDIKNKVEGHLGVLGLQLSEEKTRITHWDQPITFLGYHIHGELRDRGVQTKAVLSIPRAKERLIRWDLLHVASSYHIPELDAMLAMNAKFRGWCNYYKYANCPQVSFNRIANKMWWYYARFLARKHRKSVKQLLTWMLKAGGYKTVKKGTDRRLTFTHPVRNKEYTLDIFPPKTAVILAVTNKETWAVDVRPVSPAHWTQGRSTATRLTALARSEGICERCGENPADQVHHPNRMKTKRTLRAKVMSDKDQQQHAVALCHKCHLESHHGNYGQG